MKTMAGGGALALALQGFLADFNPRRKALDSLGLAYRGETAPSRIFALGKAAPAMARAAAELWPGTPGLLYSTGEDGEVPRRFEALYGEHPIPTRHNEVMTGKIVRWIKAGDGPLLVCVSGGGSALFVRPRAPWTLAMKAAVTRQFLERGASIREMNTVRMRLSEVKGGGLRALAGPWPVTTAIWSDVGPRAARWVSSAPTLPLRGGPSAEEVVGKYGIALPSPLPSRVPARPTVRGDRSFVMSDAIAMRRACAQWLSGQDWMAKEVACGEGRWSGDVARLLGRAALVAGRKPSAIIGVGEVRVDAGPHGGVGGRCTHLAAEVALALQQGGAGKKWAFAAIATDGVDGAAGGGAWVDSESVPAAHELREALTNFDTGSLWARRGSLVPRRPTGNNLRDLWVLVVFP